METYRIQIPPPAIELSKKKLSTNSLLLVYPLQLLLRYIEDKNVLVSDEAAFKPTSLNTPIKNAG